MKLCLGTVQFGMDYGICGGKKPSLESVISMLDYATQNGVDAIDTAVAYGDSESVVGEFINKRTISRDRLFLSSKFGCAIFANRRSESCASVLTKQISESLHRLHLNYIDAYICHDPNAVRNEEIVDAMLTIRNLGLARHVGFSVYETGEAKECMEYDGLDFMQIPFSLFDQRMSNDGVLLRAQQSGVELHSRSVFVQGLMLMNPDDVPEYLKKARDYLKVFHRICAEENVSPRTVAMAFVRNHHEISHLVFGVDNMAHLQENLRSFGENVSADLLDEVRKVFREVPKELVVPYLWKRSGGG